MKRYIRCKHLSDNKAPVEANSSLTTISDLLEEIENRFNDVEGCNVEGFKDTDSRHTTVSVRIEGIPKPVPFTVWYDYEKVKDGNRNKHKVLAWDPSYTVDSSGVVFDSKGNQIGVVQIIGSEVTSTQKYRYNYKIDSIRTDSGDVIIRHPGKAKDYDKVIEELIKRTVEVRSSEVVL